MKDLYPAILRQLLISGLCWLIVQTTFIAKVFAQPNHYTRKSVAYIDALLYTQDTDHLSAENEAYYLSKLHDGIRMARFDYNPLPQQVQAEFKRQLHHKNISEEDDILPLLNQTVVPEIIKILDLRKEMRAKELVTQAQKNSFITLKAKEMGITAQQLEQVMNASYLYIPFLADYDQKKDKNEKKLSGSLKGGLIWFHVIAGDKPRVEKIATVHSSAHSSQEKDGDSYKELEKDLLRNLSFIMAMNLQTRTRELEMFKLSAPITEVDWRTIYFPLGKAEGLKLDQPYYVGEWMENKTGKLRFQNSGFVRIGNVKDNRKAGEQLSSAWAIRKGDWVRGMTVMEHPRLGIDLALKPRWFNVTVDSGMFLNLDNDFLVVFDNYTGGVPGLDFDLQWNIAPVTKVKQSFLVLGATASIVPVRSQVFARQKLLDLGIIQLYTQTHEERLVAGYFNGYAGYLKKFYLGPFALHAEILGGVQGLSLTTRYEDEDVDLMNITVGGRTQLGLEYALNIDCNIGVFAGFTFFPALDYWVLKYKDKEVDMINKAKWLSKINDTYQAPPRIYSIGKTYGFYLHYSLPSLSFNPLKMLPTD